MESDPDTKVFLVGFSVCVFFKKGCQILVFSQFTMLLDLIQSCLCLTDTLGGAWCRLDGSMKMSDRSNEIALFSSDPSKKVFLLSLKVTFVFGRFHGFMKLLLNRRLVWG